MSETATPELITVRTEGRVGIVTLNRPKALNALNDQLMDEMGAALNAFDADDGIGCMVITGSEKAFAAGADVKEMAEKTYIDAYLGKFLEGWTDVSQTRKPVIAAVSGFCLGGGCELAMMCDFIIASDTAKFGQPEINLGIVAGMGGTQRLTRAVGKAKAMDMNLTGRFMEAAEAERAGLVSRIVPAKDLVAEAMKAAGKIAEKSALTAMMVKESVNRAQESSLAEGIRFERRMFHAVFASEDQKEGMAAFLEKRTPQFRDR
jgi:enoyl-CoA hydratase/carnithine racemase